MANTGEALNWLLYHFSNDTFHQPQDRQAAGYRHKAYHSLAVYKAVSEVQQGKSAHRSEGDDSQAAQCSQNRSSHERILYGRSARGEGNSREAL